MIKHITGTGKYIQVMGSGASTYVNNYSGAQGIGNMRYNTSSQNMEVYDGTNWITLNTSSPMIGLTADAESLLDWAKEKRQQELEIEQLAKSNPAVKIAYNAFKKAEEQLQTTIILSKDEETTS